MIKVSVLYDKRFARPVGARPADGGAGRAQPGEEWDGTAASWLMVRIGTLWKQPRRSGGCWRENGFSGSKNRSRPKRSTATLR